MLLDCGGHVLAKVHRDRLLVELDAVYPGYGLARHKGYCVATGWCAAAADAAAPGLSCGAEDAV